MLLVGPLAMSGRQIAAVISGALRQPAFGGGDGVRVGWGASGRPMIRRSSIRPKSHLTRKDRMKAAASETSGKSVIRIGRSSASPIGRGALRLSAVALFLAGGSSCRNAGSAGVEVEVVSALVSTASLQLKVLTNSCGANQIQNFFQVTNSGTAAVKLSDIKIKLWANDTSGQGLVPHVATGGCASGP